jgi:hypothetical protein
LQQPRHLTTHGLRYAEGLIFIYARREGAAAPAAKTTADAAKPSIKLLALRPLSLPR